MRCIIDIESSNLLNNESIDYTASPYKLKGDYRIWLIVAKDIDTGEIHVFRENDIRTTFVDFYKGLSVCISHNGINFDMLAIKLYTGINYTVEPDTINGKPCEIIDTLVISKTLNPDRLGGHSLDSWGKRLGDHKGSYSDWSKYTPEMETYCIQDVNLTHKVYNELLKEKGTWAWDEAIKLEKQVAEIITRQEHRGFKFDSKLAVECVKDLDEKLQSIKEEVEPVLPAKPLAKTAAKQFTPPATQFLKSGLPSTHLKNFVEKHSGVFSGEREVTIFGKVHVLPLPQESLVTHEPSTLKDTTHIKEWLVREFNWSPIQYKERDLTVNSKKQKLDKEGYEKAVHKYVEQTLASAFCKDRLEHIGCTRGQLLSKLLSKDISRPCKVLTNPTFTIGQDKEICPNLVKLEIEFPYTRKLIEFLTYSHRRNSILGGGFDPDEDDEAEKGFLANVRADGRIPTPADTCGAGTSRFKHRICANIPRASSLYGDKMRSLFGSDSECYQIGYDFDSLEAKIESHYCFKYEGGPEYGVSLTAEKPNDCHCFDSETEILTDSGWKHFVNVTYEDKVVQVDKENMNASFTFPKDIISEYYSGKMVHTQSLKIDMLVTPNHRVVFKTPRNEALQTATAEDVLSVTYSARIPTSFDLEGGINESTDLINILVAAQADGCFSKDCSAIVFGFTKERKIKSLKQSLEALGVHYTEKFFNRFGSIETTLRINASNFTQGIREVLTAEKKLPWSLINLTRESKLQAIQAIGFWDGTVKSNGDIVLDTRCTQSADVLQALVHSIGLRGTRSSFFRKTLFGEGVMERCYVSRSKDLPNMTKHNTSVVEYSGLIGCVTVDTGYIVVRRGGKVFVSGNSVLAGHISELIGKPFPRGTAKSVKYGVSYNAQPARVAKIVGCNLTTAQVVFDAFWEKAAPLRVLKENMQKYWETTGQKKFLLGLDGRKLPIRSKGNVINTAFQSAGVICAKKAMVLHDRKLKEHGFITDFFSEDYKSKTFAQQMIAYHK